jgi:hypothetical protein
MAPNLFESPEVHMRSMNVPAGSSRMVSSSFRRRMISSTGGSKASLLMLPMLSRLSSLPSTWIVPYQPPSPVTSVISNVRNLTSCECQY